MLELAQLREIARQHRVKRLEWFGSAARGREPNDYDFLVQFEPMGLEVERIKPLAVA